MMEQDHSKGKLSITYTDEQGRLTLSLARLADAFRRAGEDVFEERELAHIFNASAHRLSWELAEFEKNGKADSDIGKVLTKIVLLASDNDIERVVLPVYETGKAGEHLRKNVLYGENFSRHYNVLIDFEGEPYKSVPEVEKLGEPRKEASPSIFDFGLMR